MAEKSLRRDPNREPTHPGAILREDVLPAIGEPVATVAKKLGVTRQHPHRILAEKASVTPDMALRLGKFCGAAMISMWLTRSDFVAVITGIGIAALARLAGLG